MLACAVLSGRQPTLLTLLSLDSNREEGEESWGGGKADGKAQWMMGSTSLDLNPIKPFVCVGERERAIMRIAIRVCAKSVSWLPGKLQRTAMRLIMADIEMYPVRQTQPGSCTSLPLGDHLEPLPHSLLPVPGQRTLAITSPCRMA